MALGLFGRRWLQHVGLGAGFGWRALPLRGRWPIWDGDRPPNGRIENDQHGASLCGPSNR